jgi:hypothetical protein
MRYALQSLVHLLFYLVHLISLRSLLSLLLCGMQVSFHHAPGFYKVKQILQYGK